MGPVLLDTSAIVGWLDRSDKNHSNCVATLSGLTAPLLTCEAVIVESCYLLQGLYGATERVFDNLADGTFQIPFRLSESVVQVREILRKYRDTPADFADACLIHMANELGTGDILTLDSDFQHYRWRRNRRFNLLIARD